MIKKILNTILIVLFLSGLAHADQGGTGGNAYMWTDDSAPGTFINGLYNWIDAKDGNSLFATQIDSQVSGSVSIPFTFDFFGSGKNSLFVSANGFITFSSASSGFNTNDALPSALGPTEMIAPYWDDLVGNASQGANIYTKTIGSAPFRQFIVQWVLPDSLDFLEFQVILYETSNQIKFQYGRLTSGTTPGISATVGIQAAAGSLQKSFEEQIFQYSAVLFHGEGVSQADASISPTSSSVNTFQSFTYTINNIDPPNSDALGKVDNVSIAIPFVTSPIVTGIQINGGNAIIQNSSSKPLNRGFATWHINGGFLIIQTAEFEVIDNLIVTFYQQMPGSASTDNAYASTVSADYDNVGGETAATESPDWSVDVTGASSQVDYYTITPVAGSTTTAGTGLQYTITAFDQFGSPLANTDNVVVSAIGSSSVSFSPNDTLSFAGGSSVNVTITDTIKGTFSLRAENINDVSISGTSGLITVNPANVATITVLSSQGNIVAGTERLLRVSATDQYGNTALAGTSITFTRNTGTGLFSNGLSSIADLTDASGVSEALYTVSSVSGGTDVITAQLTAGVVNNTINLPVISGGVSYYTITPNTSTSVTAGTAVQFTINSKDQNGNNVNNSGAVTLAAQGSATAIFSAGPYQFSGGNSIVFTVTDNIKGSFNVKATNTVNTNITGQSSLVTVSANSGFQFSILSSNANITAGTSRVLRVALQDQFGNRLGAGSTVNFATLNGNGSFGGSGSTNDLTDQNGEAEATYTASTTLTTNDSIQVSFGGTVFATIVLPVVAGPLAEVRIQTTNAANGPVLGDTTITADQTLTLFAVGYDAAGFYIGNVSSNWTGSGVVTNIAPANPTNTIVFTATTTGAGSVTARAASNSAIYDNSGAISVTPGAITSIRIMTEPNGVGTDIGVVNMNTGQILHLYANGFDIDGNFNSNVPVNWNAGTLTGLSAGTTSHATLTPTAAGSDIIQTVSIYTDDATGLVTVTTSGAALYSLAIRTGANNTGTVLENATISAGSTLSLFAAGYDIYGNYIADQAVSWTVDNVAGDSTGFFTTPSTTNIANNTFNARIVNSGRLKITSGAITDYSGTIKVTNGTPTLLQAVSPQTVSGASGSPVPDSLSVRLSDGFGNVVPNATISWTTPTNGSLNPASNTTNSSGISRAKWTLRTSSGMNDTSFATFSGLTPVQFTANVVASTANSLQSVSGGGQSAQIGNPLAANFVVRVVDNNSNPVPGITVSFAITQTPAAASGQSISVNSVLTDGAGLAQTLLTLGDKTGSYVVSATNAQLLGNPITFTATATQGTFSQLLVFSGNNQTGTAGTALTNNLVVKAVDQFNNAVSGQAITWQATSNGSFNNLGSTITDVNGLDNGIWTLRTAAGADTIRALVAGIDTVTFNAAVLAGAASQIAIVSGNNRSIVAGSNQKIEARVSDQYGNPVSGELVEFLPAASMTALNSVSDINGLVSAVYKSPAFSDLSVAQARIQAQPLQIVNFNVYGLRYVAQSLSPKVASTGQATVFRVRVNNPGISAVPLNITQSTFTITDNITTVSAAVDSPSTIPVGVSTLRFSSLIPSAALTDVNYTPEIHLAGSGAYSDMNGSFFTNAAELSISPIEILSITIPNPVDTLVTVGGIVSTIQMQVRNNSSVNINTLVPDLVFSPSNVFTESLTSAPAFIPSGQTRTFTFNVTIPGGSSTGVITVDGTIAGQLDPSGDPVSDNASAVTANFRIINSGVTTWSAYAPLTITTGQNVTFTTNVQNAGIYDILLDKNNTTLQFGSNMFNLLANQALEGNGAVTQLVFTAGISSLTPGTYPGTLILNGTEFGNPYSNTIVTTDVVALSDLTVQSPAVMRIDATSATADSVSQGQTVPLTITLTNTGQSSLIVDSFSSGVYGGLTDITPALPFTVAGGIQAAFTANINVNTGTPTGNINLNVSGVGHDSNSGTAANDAAATTADSWFVTSPPNVSITSVTSTENLVSQGQTGRIVNVTVQNSGQTPVLVTNMSIVPAIGLYTQNWSPFNFRIGGNSSKTIMVSLDVKSNSATGDDSLFASINYQNVYSLETSQVTSSVFHEWFISSEIDLDILSVQAVPSQVSRGQGPVDVQVRVQNKGLTTVTVNSVNLVTSNGAANYTFGTVSPALPRIIGAGLGSIFTIPVTVNALAQTGIDTISASINLAEQIPAIADPAVNDVWQVQLTPSVVIDSVTISQTQASAGQGGIKASVYIRNTANAARASASIDSVSINMSGAGGNNQFSITKSAIPPVPFILNQGISNRFDFDVAVNSGALTGTYTINGHVRSHDINSNTSAVVNNAAQTAQLLVQSVPSVVVDSIRVIPGIISQGQSHGNIFVYVKNNGQATAEITNPTISANRGANLQQIYLGPSTPITIASGATSTLNFSFIAPPASQGLLGDISVSAQLTSKDINTDASVIVNSVTPGIFNVQTPAVPTHVSTLPVSSLGEKNEQFRVTVTNTGQATIVLNPAQTVLKIGSVLQIPLDASSPTIIAGSPAQTVLVFQNTFLTGIPVDVYPLNMTINGTTNGAAYTTDLSAGSFAYGSGLVVLNTPNVNEPSRNFLQGTTGIDVNVQVTNTSIPYSIDAGGTTLIFRDHDTGAQQFVTNLQRLDNLTTLPVGTSNLQFSFNIPSGFPIGQTDIFGSLSLNSGSIISQSADSIDIYILSGANATYVPGSISPTQAIRQQQVPVKLTFSNSGTSSLSLIVDSTYIDFPGTTIPRSNLSGNYTIGGGSSVELVFNPVTIPAGQALGNRNITWHIEGTQISGSPFEVGGTIVNALQIIAASQLQFTSINIIPAQVQQGQNHVEIDYLVANTGASDALLDNIQFNFLNNSNPTTAHWIPMTSGLFPDTILAGQNKLYNVEFSVSETAPIGIVTPAPIVEYRDIRTPQLHTTSNLVVSNDFIEVVTPALLRIDSLQFVNDGLAPNKPRVNIGQAFNLELKLANNGTIGISSAYVTLRRGTTFLQQLQVQNIGANSTRLVSINVPGISSKGEFVYSAILDSARDENGLIVINGQPTDNSETVIVQEARQLSLASAKIISPESALDSSVTLNQTFIIQAAYSQSGESNIGSGTLQLFLPGNYAFVSGSSPTQPISLQNLTATWQVRATTISPAQFDTLNVNFATVPTDLNTGQNADLGISTGRILVVAQPQGAITVNTPVKTAPFDARTTISTGQQFTLSTQVTLNENIINPTAKINLPTGYSVLTTSTKPVTGSTVTWTVIAPNNITGTHLFTVTVSGQDVNNGSTVESTSAALSLLLRSAANLTLSSTVSGPSGALDGTLSTQQQVTLQTRITNTGQAGFDGTGIMRLVAQGGIIFQESGTNILTRSGFSATTYNDVFNVPAAPGSGSIFVQFISLPNDENSNQDVLTKIDSVRNNFIFVQRANLVMNFYKADVVNDTLTRATSQLFSLRATVRNSGTAGVTGQKFLLLDTLGTGLTLQPETPARQAFSLTDTIVWNVTSSTMENSVTVRARLDSDPLDENENLSPFRTEAAKHDSINISFEQVEDIELEARYASGVPMNNDTLIVAVNQDSIYIEADIGFDPQIDVNKTATLVLPKGYSSVGTNLTRNLPASSFAHVSWFIKAPSLSSADQDTIIIKAHGENSEQQGLATDAEKKLFIRTIPKARLALQISIDLPDGAADARISENQAFRLKGLIVNRDEQSMVSGPGSVQIAYNSQNFTLIDSSEVGIDNNPNRSFTLGQPFYWWVRSSATGTSAEKMPVQDLTMQREAPTLDLEKLKKSLNSRGFELNAAELYSGEITVNITNVPNDAILNVPADVENFSANLTVTVEESAEITIQTTQAPQFVTVGQSFEYQVMADVISDNLSNPIAEFILPQSLVGGGDQIIPIPLDATTKRAKLIINMPNDYNGPDTETLSVRLSGIDINSNVRTAMSGVVQNEIHIQTRPKIFLTSEILKPESAKEGFLSFGQELEIKLWAEMAENNTSYEYAALQGGGTIALNEDLINIHGFELLPGETPSKQFTQVGEAFAITWKVRAPLIDKTTNISFSFTQLPKDVNSGLQVLSDDPSESKAITVRSKDIVVSVIDSLLSSSSFVQGQTNLPLLAFKISNQGYNDSLFVDTLKIGFYNSQGEIADNNLISGISEIFARFKVVNYDYYMQSLGKLNKTADAQNLAEISIDAGSTNPLSLGFNLVTKLGIPADQTETLLVLADIGTNAKSLSFRTKLQDINIFDVTNAIKLTAVNSDGDDFYTSSEAEPSIVSVGTSDPEKSFFIYPNPFGRGSSDIERLGYFNFYLEQPADVKIMIFTLLGDLVWSDVKTGLQATNYDKLIKWDGRNTNGNRVLNGVYIAAIEIKPASGGTKRYITKIAYIK